MNKVHETRTNQLAVPGSVGKRASQVRAVYGCQSVEASPRAIERLVASESRTGPSGMLPGSNQRDASHAAANEVGRITVAERAEPRCEARTSIGTVATSVPYLAVQANRPVAQGCVSGADCCLV
jgi:hypothetical protein